MTGSVTYKLDGSISLAKSTVVKNVFEDGNILTITANTYASGSIVFNPQNGLMITPSTPDALNVVLMTGDLKVVDISSITDTINYNGGIVTTSDGAGAHLSWFSDGNSNCGLAVVPPPCNSRRTEQEGDAGDDSIVVSCGHLTYIDGGESNDSIIGRTTSTLESSDWAMGG